MREYFTEAGHDVWGRETWHVEHEPKRFNLTIGTRFKISLPGLPIKEVHDGEGGAHIGTALQITFENGMIASLIWGIGTYSDNYYAGSLESSNDVTEIEVAAWDQDQEWITPYFSSEKYGKRNVVLGYMNAAEVGRFLAWVAEQ